MGELRRVVGDGSALRGAGRAAGPAVLPVREDLVSLFPWGGLRCGGTVAVHGSRGLLVALMGRAVTEGAWGVVVGVPELGVLAAVESGVAAGRLALVPRPGGDFVRVVAALLDGFGVVAVAGGGVREADARRLSARARSRGAVLLGFGGWPGAEVELRCARGRWTGLGHGHGTLRGQEVEVRAAGRGAAARPVRAGVTLPWPISSGNPASHSTDSRAEI